MRNILSFVLAEIESLQRKIFCSDCTAVKTKKMMETTGLSDQFVLNLEVTSRNKFHCLASLLSHPTIRFGRSTVVSNDMKPTRSFRRQKPLSHELWSERVSERANE